MKHFYKRKLPHIIVDNYAYFITARLAGSLPYNVINKLKESYQNKLEKISALVNSKEKRKEYNSLKWNYFMEFDSLMNKYQNNCSWLSDDRIALIVKEALHYRDKKVYDLIAYTIMSNHVHLVFIPFFKKISAESKYKEKYPLGGIMGSLKRHTAKEANKILNREGAFWQHESYDHIIRNNDKLYKIVEYVLNNPVKVGIAKDKNKYKWNYYKYL